MADRYAAQLEIGGQVSESASSKRDPDLTVMQALMDVIAEEGVSVAYDGKEVSPKTKRELLACVDEQSGYLCFKESQAVHGELEWLESFCRDEGIAYRRQSVCYGGYLGEKVYFDPGMEKPLILLCNDDGKEIVEAAPLREGLEMLEQYLFPPEEQPSKMWSIRDEAMAKLRGLVPDKIPWPMPRFGIVS